MNPIDNNLNADVLFYLLNNNPSVWPELLTGNKLTRTIALRCLSEASEKAIEAFPSLITELDKANRTDDNAHKVFMKIINCLHAEAQRLNCDQPYPDQTTLPPSDQVDRLAWESVHYLDLIKKVQEQTKIYKEEAFDTFVKKVAADTGLFIPDGTSARQFWDERLKDHERLKQVTKLELNDCQMKFLPPEIGLLSNLEELNLSLNQLRELPLELGKLSKLKYLYLNSNQIKEIPSQIGSLSNLIFLNISYNQISKIPEALSSLSNLRHLRLMNNSLKEISPVKQLSRLEYLNLSSNPLNKFPEEIISLKNLTSLHLNSAGLEELPSQLADLQRLKVLSLGNNHLEKIDPELIFSLPRLEELFLRTNPLNKETLLKLEGMNLPFKRTIEYDEAHHSLSRQSSRSI